MYHLVLHYSLKTVNESVMQWLNDWQPMLLTIFLIWTLRVFVRTKNMPKSIHVNIFLPSLIFFSHSWLWNRISGFLLIQFLPVNCSFSESTISLQYHYKVSFVDRHWNKWKNGEHHMVIIQGIWKSKLFLVIPPPAQSHNIVIQFFVET